jgi:hypothetical protein
MKEEDLVFGEPRGYRFVGSPRGSGSCRAKNPPAKNPPPPPPSPPGLPPTLKKRYTTFAHTATATAQQNICTVREAEVYRTSDEIEMRRRGSRRREEQKRYIIFFYYYY